MTFRPTCFASNTTLMLNLELPPRSKKLSPRLTLSKRKTLLPDFREDALHFRQRRLIWHGQRRGRLKIMSGGQRR